MKNSLLFIVCISILIGQKMPEWKKEQPLKPHPLLELIDWDVHNGEISFNKANNFKNKTI